MIGIYKIKNLINNKVYIGSSIDILGRISEHKSMLRKGNHDNEHLQKSWNKYGEKNFIFGVVEIVENKYDLLYREQCWFDFENIFGTELYNMSPIAGNQLGFKHSNKTKELYSIMRRGNGNAMYGKKHSEETKIKIGTKSKGRKNKGFLGHNHTEKSKNKISNTLKEIKYKDNKHESQYRILQTLCLLCYNIPTHKYSIWDYREKWRDGESKEIYPFIEREYNEILE